MHSSNIYHTIRQTILSELPDCRIILFGSRARGDFDKYSDYDLLIVTATTITPDEKIRWSSRLHKATIKAIHAPVDILINSEVEIEEKGYCLDILSGR